MVDLKKYDTWLKDGGPAAMVIREYLIPVEGVDGVFFPATYAAQQGADKDKGKFQGGYNIDRFPDGTNVCLVDSVGSQANRIEPLFAQDGYADLIPQIFVTFPEKGIRLNLLHANHRAADAIVRCSAYERELRSAFLEMLRGNAAKLAYIAPTSLVFGVWDSRDTSAKVPRLLTSTIRAFNVREHTRSANFLTQMTIDLAKLDILPDAGSEEGFANALASKVPGGVQLSKENGSIRRDMTVGLAALRRLTVLDADGGLSIDQTMVLRRYILGLALVAITAPHDPYLRQGCNLVPDYQKPSDFKLVNLNGTPSDIVIIHSDAIAYARSAMKEFGVSPNREERFDAALAEKASDAKPEKVKGVVVSVDIPGRTFKLKAGRGKEIDIVVNDATIIKKGKEPAIFDDAVVADTTLNVEVLGNIAVAITVKR